MLNFELIFHCAFSFLTLFSSQNPHKFLVQGQIIIVPKQQVQEPFKNNPKWEDFKTTQFDRIKVLGTLVSNVWQFLDTVELPDTSYPFRDIFVRYHVPAFVNFFKESEARLVDGNPYAIMDPAIGIHTMESLFKLSNVPSNDLLEQLKIKWMEIDSLALSIHLYFNETTKKILDGDPNIHQDIFKGKTFQFPTWISKSSESAGKSLTMEELTSTVDKEMAALGPENHLIRGLVKLLSSMTQNNVDNQETLNYYCFGNNEYGVFQDIYEILTDAALYLCMMDMKKLVLDVYLVTYAKFFQVGAVTDSVEERLRLFNLMVERVKRKIDFEYLQGSDFTELPHPPIFKCDKVPEESGIPTQWGRNLTTGISPAAGATYSYDPQAGPEKEDGNVGYIDDRTPDWDYLEFDKAFHGYLESEMVLNPQSECKGTCRDYKRPTPTCEGKGIDCQGYRQSHCDPSDSDCMARNKCPEYAKNCIRTSQSVSMCYDQKDTRYYNHFKFSDGHGVGVGDNNKTEPACQGDIRKAKERWEMEFGIIMNSPQYCELCLCTCMTPQDPAHQHYINLQPILADSGFVVSAVKFVQIDRVLSLTIEQGKPLKKGNIDLTTTKWVTPASPSKNDSTQAIRLGMKGFLRLNFDVIVGEANQVVTGVRFKLSEADKSLSLEVQVTPISWPPNDPSTITLNGGQSIWIESQKYENIQRKPLKFYKPNSPARQQGPSMPDVVYNSYTEFEPTDYEQDLAQSTIPFFDAQPVQHYESKRWLQGLGLMHKGKPQSGGFISPLIIPSKGKKSS